MINFKNLKVGQILSESSYYTVEKIVGNKAQLKHNSGDSVVLDEDYISKLLKSADDFTSTVILNRTEIAKKFIDASNIALTVTFQKKVDEKTVVAELEALYPNKGGIISATEFNKKVKQAVKRALEGETRVLKGYHWGEQDEFGRVQVIDMEASGFGQRQVDTRTITQLIVNGVQYKVK